VTVDNLKILITQMQSVACDLPAKQVEELARLVSVLTGPTASGRRQAVALAPAARFATAVTSLWSAWGNTPELDGKSIALALRTASAVATANRSAQTIEVAWTGPLSVHVPVRMSSHVLVELIEEAREHLIVVSFVAYRDLRVIDALRRAAARGVDVNLILESAGVGGRLERGGADVFKELHGCASFWVWPREKRPADGVSMHAKAAIADRSAALVTSANLTGHALDLNMELGLLVRGGSVPARLADHFNALFSSGELVEIQPG
jgi:phosphatidylserine/phosphatidylglycerophosphate/cardiolipin synthase-like enzyme